MRDNIAWRIFTRLREKPASTPIQVISSPNNGATSPINASAAFGRGDLTSQQAQQRLVSPSPTGHLGSEAPAWAHFNPQGGEEALLQKLNDEVRDPIWAQTAEKAITNQINQIPSFSSSPDVQALCGRTICRVTGSTSEGQSPAEQVSAFQTLQTPELQRNFKGQGLDRQLVAFGSELGKPKFTIFLVRAPAA